MEGKKCSKCKEIKDSSSFSNCLSAKDGLQWVCKRCRRLYQIEHKDQIKQRTDKNKEKITSQIRKWRKDNDLKMREQKKEYYQKHKKTIIERHRLNHHKRYKFDINYKLTVNLRNRLNRAIEDNYKSGSAVRDLGCSIQELKLYLESQFTEEMNWNNHGKWHIDHIKPLASFDLTKREELLKACNYTNLQPLWAVDNLKKGDRTSSL